GGRKAGYCVALAGAMPVQACAGAWAPRSLIVPILILSVDAPDDLLEPLAGPAEHVEAIARDSEILPIVLAAVDDVGNWRPSCSTKMIPRLAIFPGSL